MHMVEEQNRIKGLVLGAGRNIAVARHRGEEVFEFLCAGKALGHLAQGGGVAPEPEKKTLFGGESFVLTSDDVPHPVDCL